MKFSDLPWRPTTAMLRNFSGLSLVFVGSAAAWQYWVKDRPSLAIALALLALTIGSVGLVKPHAVQPVFVVWLALAFPVGWTVSQVALAMLLYGMFTPLAVVFRLMRRDVLWLKRPKRDSYWTPKPAPRDAASYLRPF